MVITPHGRPERLSPEARLSRLAFNAVLENFWRLRAQWDYKFKWGDCLYDSVAYLMPHLGTGRPQITRSAPISSAAIREEALRHLAGSSGGRGLSPGAQAALLATARERPGAGLPLPSLAEVVASTMQRLKTPGEAPDRAGWANGACLVAVSDCLRIRVVTPTPFGGMGMTTGFWSGTDTWPQYSIAYKVVDQSGAGHYTPCHRMPGWRDYVPDEHKLRADVDLTHLPDSPS